MKNEKPVYEKVCKKCGYHTKDTKVTECPKCHKILVEITEEEKKCQPLYD